MRMAIILVPIRCRGVAWRVVPLSPSLAGAQCAVCWSVIADILHSSRPHSACQNAPQGFRGCYTSADRYPASTIGSLQLAGACAIHNFPRRTREPPERKEARGQAASPPAPLSGCGSPELRRGGAGSSKASKAKSTVLNTHRIHVTRTRRDQHGV